MGGGLLPGLRVSGDRDRDRSEKWSARELRPSTMLLRDPYGEEPLKKLLFSA